jgi:hypothetical protein
VAASADAACGPSGMTVTCSASGIGGIGAFGYGGADTLTMELSAAGEPMAMLFANGGTGNDNLTGGSDDDIIYAEEDNDTVTGGTRLLTLHDSLETYYRSGAYQRVTGTWISISIDEEQDSVHSYLRQTNTTGDARVFSRTAITNQVVSARMQPQAWGSTTGTQDPWIGVAARVVDDRNYLYLSLRRSGQLSLRKVVNGAIQVIGTVPVTVATQRWYDLRLEVIGNHIRGFVNGDLKFELDDSTLAASGRSGVLMYKASSDLWQWVTYQP